jgi:2-oxoisovalerate dehydrogenase E2 component (dihydrolipoyl transacylase)
MPTTITMPQLGETVTEGTVAQWLKNVGDSVEKYEPFVEVSTDKVNAEVPSPVSGTIVEIIAKAGETVPTGAPIAVIAEVGAAVAPAPPAGASAPAPAAAAPAHDEPVPGHTVGLAAAPHGAQAPHSAHIGGNGASVNPPELLRRVSPAVRRLAREHRVDLAHVRGTGTGGRITANDVLAAAAMGPAAAVAATIAAAPEAPPPAPVRSAAAKAPVPVPGEILPLTQARRIIAQRMVESKQTAPHAWTMVEVDVSNVWAWRSREKDRFARERDMPLTLLPFFIRAVVESIKAYPLMNSRFTAEGIEVHKQVHIGIAVALDGNLMVPVIRDADTLSIAGLALAAGRIIARARAGKLTADDLTGGTFTVNNTGANGSILSAPILNGGQAGIVTMEAVVKRPVVVAGDAIAVRSMMNVCLSLDHRVIDGAVASAFLVDLKRRLEAMGPSGTL